MSEELQPYDPESAFVAFASEEACAMLAEVQPTPADLQRLVVPSGASAAAFEIMRDGETEVVKHIELAILWKSPTERSFYATSIEETPEAGPPHCSSPDGVIGTGCRDVSIIKNFDPDPDSDDDDAKLPVSEQECASCPFAQFGSALGGGKGQACKQSARIVGFIPGQLLPVILSVPPTSLKPLRAYGMQLLSGMMRVQDVVTKVSLKKQPGSIDYYTLEFSKVRALGTVERAVSKRLAAGIGATMTR